MLESRRTWIAFAVAALLGWPSVPVLAGEPSPVGGAAFLPAGLAVDTAGNRVLEPNETAVVAPSWTNFCACNSHIIGTAFGFTGPAGPVYTITDNVADYGTVPGFSTASCAATGDCFGVLATAGTRPVTHWDSSFLESVSLNSKTWTLHIGGSFTDVPPANPFYRFVETILHRNVTGGCGTDTYCPAAATTREQIAVFVLVAKEGPGFTPQVCVAGSERFTDMPASSPFCKWVEEIARRLVVNGCGAAQYCPGQLVTREQMAVFALKTADPPFTPPACVAGAEMFADLPAGSPFCKWVEELVRRGVVSGCGGGTYCPAANVSREQMAVFLTVTFGLTLYGL
jgi:hypothetical protein